MVDKQEEKQATAVVEPTLHPAVELLLARMKSNPDEFYPKGHRWQKLIAEYSGYLTEAEHVALNEGQREIAVGAFHVAVMNELLCEPEEEMTQTSGNVRVGVGGPSSYYNNVATSIGTAGVNTLSGISASQISQMNTQDKYQQLLRQMQSAQNVYPRTQTPAPADVAKPKGWLGGIF